MSLEFDKLKETASNGLNHATSRCTILIPSLGSHVHEPTVDIALSLLGGPFVRAGSLVLLGIIEVMEKESLSTAVASARGARRRLNRFDMPSNTGVATLKKLVRVTRDRWDAIQAVATQEACNLLIIPWSTNEGPGCTANFTFADSIERSPSNAIMVNVCDSASYKNIVVAIRDGVNSEFILDSALLIKSKYGCDLTLARVLSGETTAEEFAHDENMLALHLAKKGLKDGDYKLVAVCKESESDSMRAILREHDLVVLGPGDRTAIGQGYNRNAVEPAIEHLDTPMFAMRPEFPLLNTAFASAETAMRNEDITVSERVDKWFAEKTFHADEFADIERLVELKQRQGLTISLGLPALNEEKTIGTIIETIKAELFKKYPLIDQIAVIDSCSTDKTVQIAHSCGVQVFSENKILPAWGSKQGKGCALWKSLYVLDGDIIAWIDTDIKNIHPRFVYGLIGPLIMYPDIQYVKGFYRRPVEIGNTLFETGGGRVTELTARPLLNMFFPELSGLIQPLSGEYAGRRAVLEKVGFYNGYGVEIGLLINILEQFGIDAIAQVDLIERIHRNQPLVNLSKMSFALIQVIMERLEKRHSIRLPQDMRRSMNIIKSEPGQFYLDPNEIIEVMKPPIITLPEYRDAFKDIPREESI